MLNRDDPQWGKLARSSPGRAVTYGTHEEADLRLTDVVLSPEQTTFALETADARPVEVATPLVGLHNALNLTAAVAAAQALGVDLAHAVRGARQVTGVPGRLERVAASAELHAYVDYAHTEEALREVLAFLGEVGDGPVVCVVGCGGDRDRTKRPRMARAAAELAARVYLTSDNPRTEDPLAILRDMEAGVPAELRTRVSTVPDRAQAIEQAVLEAPSGACVLVAGKGHEDYQILGTEKIPFDDARELRRALAARRQAIDGVRPGRRPGTDEV